MSSVYEFLIFYFEIPDGVKIQPVPKSEGSRKKAPLNLSALSLFAQVVSRYPKRMFLYYELSM